MKNMSDKGVGELSIVGTLAIASISTLIPTQIDLWVAFEDGS